ncbi:uncharacterized protein LOC131039488 [Cryptomeria japonica]|uniref:uncharacterized protein LOC131039488 n=1 Tax=Cryptomeria japonica TaxID=3369 RepID=UPI0027DAA883|nr:uncharacterized protein LOC131039488 [Cryptomeria japonica]XP_057828255.2 uncharacterized protein LOC131039488 [Cryptomeria japonica]
MRDFASCFGEHAVQVADYSSSSSSTKTHINNVSNSSNGLMMQNMVTCIYQTVLNGQTRLITVTWCKNLMGQGLSVNVDDPSCQCMCKVDMKSWFFWKKKGCKRFELGASKVDVFWDLSCAKYGSGPEPLEGYYVAVVSEDELGLLLGDMSSEAYKRTHSKGSGETLMISRKEHVFGKNFYSTKAQFCESGKSHDIVIECQTGGPRDPRLCVRIDKQVVVQVKHLIWKFRGNQTILVDGLPVEMLWDVHDWFFNPNLGHAVFMFKTNSSTSSLSSSSSFSSLAEESWSSKSLSQSFNKQRETSSHGFSLLLYAWKNE